MSERRSIIPPESLGSVVESIDQTPYQYSKADTNLRGLIGETAFQHYAPVMFGEGTVVIDCDEIAKTTTHDGKAPGVDFLVITPEGHTQWVQLKTLTQGGTEIDHEGIVRGYKKHIDRTERDGLLAAAWLLHDGGTGLRLLMQKAYEKGVSLSQYEDLLDIDPDEASRRLSQDISDTLTFPVTSDHYPLVRGVGSKVMELPYTSEDIEEHVSSLFRYARQKDVELKQSQAKELESQRVEDLVRKQQEIREQLSGQTQQTMSKTQLKALKRQTRHQLAQKKDEETKDQDRDEEQSSSRKSKQKQRGQGRSDHKF